MFATYIQRVMTAIEPSKDAWTYKLLTSA